MIRATVCTRDVHDAARRRERVSLGWPVTGLARHWVGPSLGWLSFGTVSHWNGSSLGWWIVTGTVCYGCTSRFANRVLGMTPSVGDKSDELELQR